MKIGIRAAVHRCLTYPILFPFIAGYILTKDAKMLDQMYFIRSIPHGIPMRHGLRLAKYNGNFMLFPSREDPNIDDVFLRDVYYPYKPQNTDIIFDVGAHMGFFTHKVAKQVAKVVAFEPDPYNFDYLSSNIDYNKLTNVTALNCALGDRDGSSFLNRSYGHGRSRLTSSETEYKIKVKKLDSVVKQLGLNPNVIKIDTEGYELKVLKGARFTLDHYKPKLLIASYHYPTETSDVVEFLEAMSFDCFTYRVPLTLQKSFETYVYAKPNARIYG